MKHEIVKVLEEMEEVTHCMYCGAELDKIERKNVKMCPKMHVRIQFVKVGDIVNKMEKLEKGKIITLRDVQVSPKLHRELSLCKPSMIS